MPQLSRWWAGRLLTIAHYCHARGDLDEAAHHANRALRIATRTGPVELYALASVTAAEIGTDAAAYAPSRARLEATVQLLETAPPARGESRLLARTLTCLGDNHRRAGHYREATMFLDKALHLLECEIRPDPAQLARVLTALAIAAKEQGAYAEAARRYATIVEMYERDGPPWTARATLHHNLAGLSYALRQYPRAEAQARQAIALRCRGKVTQVALAADLAVLAASIAAQDRHDEARDHLERALGLSRAARPPRYYDIAVQLHLLATIDHATGQMESAERRYGEALSIKERLLGHTHPEIVILCDNLETLRRERRRNRGRQDQQLTQFGHGPGLVAGQLPQLGPLLADPQDAGMFLAHDLLEVGHGDGEIGRRLVLSGQAPPVTQVVPGDDSVPVDWSDRGVESSTARW